MTDYVVSHTDLFKDDGHAQKIDPQTINKLLSWKIKPGIIESNDLSIIFDGFKIRFSGKIQNIFYKIGKNTVKVPYSTPILIGDTTIQFELVKEAYSGNIVVNKNDKPNYPFIIQKNGTMAQTKVIGNDKNNCHILLNDINAGNTILSLAFFETVVGVSDISNSISTGIWLPIDEKSEFIDKEIFLRSGKILISIIGDNRETSKINSEANWIKELEKISFTICKNKDNAKYYVALYQNYKDNMNPSIIESLRGIKCNIEAAKMVYISQKFNLTKTKQYLSENPDHLDLF